MAGIGPDAAGASGAGVLGLAPDQRGEPLAQVVRRHQKIARGRGRDAGGQLVEDRRRVRGQLGVRTEQPEVFVQPGRPLVVVSGADVDIPADAGPRREEVSR
jgi:hypothetical protein